MLDPTPSPFHDLPSGLCEDSGREASALIQRMARGDGGALLELHGMWAPTLLGIACRMLGDRRSADDLLRRVFARIWKSASSFDPHQSPPFVWAFAMLRDAAVESLHRSKVPRRETPEHECNETPTVLSADDCRRLKNALERLDPEARICLEQAVFLDLSHCGSPDAAAAPTGPLKPRLRQALETVRGQLSCHEL